ncbi:MAG: DUF2062 domain-containing protein [Candidatus Omnitrophota bacterium]
MLSFINIPAKVIGILEANISPREIAAGVCLAVFLGFVPLNGPMALLLAVFFFVFRINRVATLLTLPLFKTLYILGASRLTDAAGTAILEKAQWLDGFFRWLTHLPVIAYLDLNNTLIAGGLAVSLAFSIPAYFVSKKASAVLISAYSARMKDSAFAKWASGIKMAGLMGPDAAATLKNVQVRVKQTLIGKIRRAMSKPGKPKSAFLKRINVAGIAVIITLLAAFHLGVGFFISPALSSFIVDNLNRYTPARITVDKVNIWPLTLSFSLKGMKVFDPEKEGMRIAKADLAVIRVSPLALLSRRMVFSDISMTGAEIDVEGTADGSFNISRLAVPKSGAAKTGADFEWRALMQKKDWFGKIYGSVRKRFSKKGQEKIKEDRKKAREVTVTTEALPKGKLVKFRTAKDLYLFEIRRLDIRGARINVKANGRTAELDKADIRMTRLAYDPENGMALDLLDMRGVIKRGGVPAGGFDIFFSKNFNRDVPTAVFRVELKDVDMTAVSFIYEDSLPVRVEKGIITLGSRTSVTGDAIASRNEIHLRDHSVSPKPGGSPTMGLIPISAVCDAVNHVNPLTLKFDIGGTVERPEFGSFQESLMALIKPYITDFQEKIKNEGLRMLDNLLKKKGDGQ